ncbi:hypothetical protein GH714_003293 [Hevea brasiliensis]|uniref:Aspartate aminotransferase n=1 Tax=Hevea brasiliensis TaxID=3981 RepID=A0A6A6LYK2_HEVBR|nr:hypothetical protein GH714_003293 [Hevea brasiliensis]
MTTSRCFSTSIRALHWWDHVCPAPKDPITSVTEAFLADTSPVKINLGVGAYRDDEGKPIILQCLRDAEAKIAGCDFLESISSAVSSKLVEESVKLVYGKDSDVIKEGRYAGVQALSGTGACRLFAEFQKRFHPESQIYLPNPTWSNHHNIWRDAQVQQNTFSYYHPDLKGLNFTALMDDVKNAPDGSFFLLHPCAHNPTGVDPTEEQWREISHQFKGCFIHSYFLEDGHLLGCAQSFAKNMGLYGHRVGCLSVLCNDMKQAVAIKSQLQKIARAMYSSPPGMANCIQTMRTNLQESLWQLGSSLNWQHITNQVGMFCFSGLTPKQVDWLAREFHIYMTHDGRMSMAGVTTGNVNYLANAIHEVTKYGENA